MPVRQRMPRVLSACSMQLRRGWAAVSRLVGPAARVGAVVLPRGQSEARQLVDVPDLPPGWFAARDGGKGEIYYFNDRTGEVRCGLLVRRGVGGREVAWWSRPVRSAGGEELCVSVWPRVCFSAVAALPSAHSPHCLCCACALRRSWSRPAGGAAKPAGRGAATVASAVDPASAWEALLSNHGEVYYWKKSTDEVAWEAPAGWCEANGRILEGERGTVRAPVSYLWCACAAACVALQAMRHIPDRDRDFTSLPVRGGRWRCWGDPRHSAASLHGCIGVCFMCGGGVGGWGGLRA